jgi:dienelactone hydrolase
MLRPSPRRKGRSTHALSTARDSGTIGSRSPIHVFPTTEVLPLGGTTRASERVSSLVDGEGMRRCLSQPEKDDQVPGIVIIIEVFGVNTHKQEVMDQLSREGCVAIGPIVYITVGAAIPSLATPVANFGALDHNPTPEAVSGIEAELRKHGEVGNIGFHAGANHGMHCDEQPRYLPRRREISGPARSVGFRRINRLR